MKTATEFVLMASLAMCSGLNTHPSSKLFSPSPLRMTPGDFSSKSNGLYLPNQGLWGGRDLRMMPDPDVPPEVDPTRRDPDDPGPEIPVRYGDGSDSSLVCCAPYLPRFPTLFF
jgi:hypothetical protein